MRYIALLRGINVSGQKKLPMKELVVSLQNAGLKDVAYYIQSGNLAFTHFSDHLDLKNLIEAVIQKDYGFEVDVFIKTPDTLRAVISGNPFPEEDRSQIYVTFFSQYPDQELLDSIESSKYPGEEFVASNDWLYFHAGNGYGKAKMNNNFFERKLKLSATTRNWKTVLKLAEMGDQY